MKQGETDRILVLDGHKNNSLIVTRSLSRKGVEVTAGGWSRLSPCLLSRHSDATYLYPKPEDHPKRFVDHLIEYLEDTDHLAVVPMSDLTHMMLSKRKDEIEGTGTIVGTEDWETFVAANDKKRIADLTEELSIPAPATYAPESLDDVESLKGKLSYPVLIKPRSTTVMDGENAFYETRISDGNYVHSPDELVSRYRTLVEGHAHFKEDPPLVQEVIPGEITATCGIAKDGEFTAFFQEERLRMYPISGGASALRQGIYEPEMLEYARDIVEALEWTGPIYVEFIRSDDGEFYLLEVNGRYWGSVGCAVASGVDVPFLHYLQFRGIDRVHDQNYRTDVKQRRLFYTDIKWLAEKLRNGEVGAVVPFATSFFDSKHDVFAIDDPLPTVSSVAWIGRGLIERTALSRILPETDRWSEANEPRPS